MFLLREYLLQLDGEKAAWEARATAISLQDPVRARAAYDRLTESLAGLRATKQYLERQLANADSRLRDEEARQRTATHTDTPASRLLIDTLRQRQRDLRKALDDATPLERLVGNFRADFEDRRAASVTARLKDRWAEAGLAARDVWNYELFAIDDSFETAEGRKLAVSRSVTVGKTFGAALIVLIGYWLSRFVVRRIERKAVAAGRATPQGAALVRKWILFVVAAILGLVALVSASIPLTAFAFLGGALAIAAGFGLQTLLKNLVSGRDAADRAAAAARRPRRSRRHPRARHRDRHPRVDDPQRRRHRVDDPEQPVPRRQHDELDVLQSAGAADHRRRRGLRVAAAQGGRHPRRRARTAPPGAEGARRRRSTSRSTRTTRSTSRSPTGSR